METAKKILLLFSLSVAAGSCGVSNSPLPISAVEKKSLSNAVRIANDALEYEIIIIDPGFNSWLATNARPRKFYSQSYFEARNLFWVLEWNTRVRSPMQFRPVLYEMEIDYQANIDYGYEVNYLLFNYFVYFQISNKTKFGAFDVRL